VLTETPRNLGYELKAVNSSIRKSSKQSRNKQIQGKFDIAHTMKLLEISTKGSIQIIKSDIKSPMTRNLGKTVLSKQFTADKSLNNFNEVMTKTLQPKAKLILKNMKMMDKNKRNKKKLSHITTKIKDIIDRYKKRETLLINENKRLKEQVKHLIKTLEVYEMFT
jgi:hypothetical protein